MAIIHEATLVPGKLELLNAWLPRQPWAAHADVPSGADLNPDAELNRLGTYRFDDPDGEVGIEGFLLGRGSAAFHVVVTYRGAPLEGAESGLIGTMEHSVLGSRWVYDGLADPVALAALARAVRGQQDQAVLELHSGGKAVGRREPDVRLRSAVAGMEASRAGASSDDGAAAEVSIDGATLRIARELGAEMPEGPSLIAEWAGAEAVLACLM